jgi:acyl-CoA thioesterase-1
MKRRMLSLATMLTLAAAFACPVLAADAPAAPAGEKLLAEAIKLVSPAKSEPKELLLKAGDQIVCMGDSITAAGGYLRHMNAMFAQQYPDLKLPKIINAGVSGHKAENCIARFEKDVLKKKPDLMTLNIGINDVWHRLRAPHDPKVLATYKDNVGKMVEQAQAAGIKVILLTPTVIKEDPKGEGQKRLALYANAMRELSVEKKCGFVDLHQMFLDALAKKPEGAGDKWLTRDGVHMKPLGDAVMAVAALRGMGVPDTKTAETIIPLPKPRKPRPKKTK